MRHWELSEDHPYGYCSEKPDSWNAGSRARSTLRSTNWAGGTRPPLEIVHAVVERADSRFRSRAGTAGVSFNHVIVHLVAAARDKEVRARYAIVAEGPPTLAERLTSRLRSAGCRIDALTAELAFSTKAGADWQDPSFHVEFDRIEAAPPPSVPATIPSISLVAAPKAARQRVHAFTGGRIDIGRGAEVLDQRHRLIRTNHIAFSDDGPDANTTISRRHAHVAYDAAAAVYRVFDDHSLHGTSIIRNGRTIRVPPSARGTRLQTGDELAIGQARCASRSGDGRSRTAMTAALANQAELGGRALDRLVITGLSWELLPRSPCPGPDGRRQANQAALPDDLAIDRQSRDPLRARCPRRT